MMLDPFGIALRGLGVEPEAQEEPQDNLVALPAFLGKRPAFLGQEDRAILRTGDQAVPRQTAEGFGDRRCGNAHPGRDIDRSGFAVLVDQFSDQFGRAWLSNSQFARPRGSFFRDFGMMGLKLEPLEGLGRAS